MATSILIDESELPESLTIDEAVDAAYPSVLAEVADNLRRGLPTLVECDKDMAPYVYINLRGRLRPFELKCQYLDGRPAQDAPPEIATQGFSQQLIHKLREVVRSAVDKRVAVLPHLDLLTTTQGGLTGEAREAISLLYENPELVWLGFKDPSFCLPAVIENLFPRRVSLLGPPRERLRRLVTRAEARKFGQGFNPWSLYKYVSGVNAVRLRRLLSSMDGEDYPSKPDRAFRWIREATTTGGLEIPQVDLEHDIGGYQKVKTRLRKEILEILQLKDRAETADQITAMEELIPKGMIFSGPPGTGKTLFAKAMASSIGAAVTIVSGPELKSRWVGESEENLRQIFHQARQSAPAVIVFDELDSFAAARGTYTGSGVEHSMVNQLLTEMDGFHREELVFVVGTTNFVEILDPALLRPGRFEFQLHIPHPDADDRREILAIHDRRLALRLSEAAFDYAVARTGDFVEGAAAGTRFTGDHINALCRAIARIRLREAIDGATSPELVERALSEWIERPRLTDTERRVVATHEAGHAVCSLLCEHTAPIKRISIQADTAGALGYVLHQDPAHRHVWTRARLLDDLCVLVGGREAESLLMNDVSVGAASDLERATAIARSMVEEFGMGGTETGLISTPSNRDPREPHYEVSQESLAAAERQVRLILRESQSRAAAMLRENVALLETLRDGLLENDVIDAATLRRIREST